MFYSQLSGSDLLLLRENLLYSQNIMVSFGEAEETTPWEKILMDETAKELEKSSLDYWLKKEAEK